MQNSIIKKKRISRTQNQNDPTKKRAFIYLFITILLLSQSLKSCRCAPWTVFYKISTFFFIAIHPTPIPVTNKNLSRCGPIFMGMVKLYEPTLAYPWSMIFSHSYFDAECIHTQHTHKNKITGTDNLMALIFFMSLNM